jgi:2-amino-4-hydroxy-6-hydroxymethyldihydropteridine diphosphokinase
MSAVYLSIGSNEGDRQQALSSAVALIGSSAGQVIAISSVYESEPWGFLAVENFLNLVMQIETRLEPTELMDVLLTAEKKLGRSRSPGSYQSRIIDIDILFYEDRDIQTLQLCVPHPRLHLRRFVLQPLSELAPELVHPRLGISVRQLLVQCEDQGMIRVYQCKRSKMI